MRNRVGTANGGGMPNVALVQPCTTAQPLTVGTSRCNTQGSGLPPFDGQPYYSSGVVAPGTTFVLHLAANIAPGAYSFGCLIHPAQHGTLIIVPSDVAIQSKSQLQETAASELARDRTALARLLTTRVVPPAGVTVQAGETTGEVSVNQFFANGHDQGGPDRDLGKPDARPARDHGRRRARPIRGDLRKTQTAQRY